MAAPASRPCARFRPPPRWWSASSLWPIRPQPLPSAAPPRCRYSRAKRASPQMSSMGCSSPHLHSLRFLTNSCSRLTSTSRTRRKRLTGNAAVVVIRQGMRGGGAVARKGGPVHECQRARLELGEAADGRAHGGIEGGVLEHVLGSDRRPDNIAVGQCTVVAKLGEQVAAH